MTIFDDIEPYEKLPTGVEGLERITLGGLPQGRATLIAGTSGSGKTMLATEITYRGIIEFDRRVVYVTFEERPSEIVRNVKRMGWDLAPLISDGRLDIVDACGDTSIVDESGSYNLEGLIAVIRAACREIDADFVVLDSIGSLFERFRNQRAIRSELFRLTETMREDGLTCLITAERLEDYGSISKHGVEEFVADNVVILRNVLIQERCRRTIQVLKMRGDSHTQGEYPFTITDTGVSVVISPNALELRQGSSFDRVGTGNSSLDRMSGGGFFRDSITLLSGPTGSGKTLLCTTFAWNACQHGEKVLFLAFEESHDQLLRNASGWGMDFVGMEESGHLRITCIYPESRGIEEHLLRARHHIEEFRPQRLVVDSISALERVSSIQSFREFIIGLTAFVKHQKICTFLTCTTTYLSGGDSITEGHISTITDAIILLRYVEINGRLRRGLSVIKMRGSQHDKEIYEFMIGSDGLEIGKPFRNVHNILLGIPHPQGPQEDQTLGNMFE